MGECGCGDTTPEFRLPGPDGITYGIEIYGSCHYCETPAGVVIYRFDAAEAAVWLDGVEDAPLMAYDPERPTNAQLAIPIVDPEFLMKALEDAVEVEPSDMRLALPAAVHATRSEWHRTRRGGE